MARAAGLPARWAGLTPIAEGRIFCTPSPTPRDRRLPRSARARPCHSKLAGNEPRLRNTHDPHIRCPRFLWKGRIPSPIRRFNNSQKCEVVCGGTVVVPPPPRRSGAGPRIYAPSRARSTKRRRALNQWARHDARGWSVCGDTLRQERLTARRHKLAMGMVAAGAFEPEALLASSPEDIKSLPRADLALNSSARH